MLKLYIQAKEAIHGLRKDEDGASLAEYALLIALITAALAATIGLLGTAITTAISEGTSAING